MRLRLSVVKGIGAGVLVLLSAACGGRALAAGAHPLRVQDGVLTVNGLTVQAGLDLRIPNLRYLYIAVPGSGTAVIAEKPFAGAQEERAAFRGNALTVVAGGSRLQLTAGNRMRGTRSAYVRFDRGVGPSRGVPVLRYGDSAMMPAVWEPESSATHYAGRRLRVKGSRSLRMAKLCRPSRHGKELCATIREVMYKP